MRELALAVVTIGGGGLLAPLGLQSIARARAPRTPPSSRPGPSMSLPPIPRTFDTIFLRHGQGLPLAYLRALAWHESRLDPKHKNPKSSATGLLQVIDVVRNDHNRLHGTAYTRRDLEDPVVNVTVAATLLRRIARSLANNHPAIPTLAGDWNDYRYVELLTFAWNAGWSETAGLGRVARYLEGLGIHDITAELIHQHARAAGATRHLSNETRLRWSQKVARHYAAERAREGAPSEPPHLDDPQDHSTPPEHVEARQHVERPGGEPPEPVDALPVTSPSQVDPG